MNNLIKFKGLQPFVRVYYGFLASLLTFTVIAQCILTHQEGRSLVNTFSYFTIQSNILVLITSAILAITPTIKGKKWRIIRLAALAGITVTGIVYTLVLAKYVHLTGLASLYNHIFHYFVPFATVVGFVIVEPRLNLRRSDMAFMVWPVAWLVYTMARGAIFRPDFTGFSELPSHYPYEFLDIDRVPLSEFIGAVVIITAILVAVGAAYIKLDQLLSKSLPSDSTNSA